MPKLGSISKRSRDSISKQQENNELEDSICIWIKVEEVQNISTELPSRLNVRVEYSDELLGESEFSLSSKENRTAVNLEVSLWCSPTKPVSLDKLAANPVHFTLTEGNNKPARETQKKENESHVLGCCNLDLLPFLLGETMVKTELLVQQNTGMAISWPNLPRLVVSAHCDQPLLVPEKIEEANILYITLGSMCNAPVWMTDTMEYSATIAVPLHSQELQNINFEGGYTTSLKNVENTKRWAGLSTHRGRVSHSTYKMSGTMPKCALQVDVDATLDSNSPRIEWNVLRRCWIPTQAVDAMRNILNRYQSWPLEILISNPQQISRGTTRSKSKEMVHLVAYLDLTSLLCPGETQVRAAAQVFTFCLEDFVTKFCMEKPVYETTPPEPGSKLQKPATQVSKSEPMFSENGELVFVVVEVQLLKPLLMKRTTSELEARVLAELPSRPKLPLRAMTAELAEQHYVRCIQTAVNFITNEFQKYIGLQEQHPSVQSDICPCAELERDFSSHLRNSEMYPELKELLRNKLSLLIKEKCNTGQKFNSSKEKQNFISDVYTFVIEEMHVAIKGIVTNGTEQLELTCNQLLAYAAEASEEGQLDQANQLLLQRITQDDKNADYWIDYGVFCLEHRRLDRARECIKEALSLNIRHMLGLLLYGIILAQNEECQLAETFLEAATHFYPRMAEAWLVLHLFYLKTENYPCADVALAVGKKCFESNKDPTSLVTLEHLSWSSKHYSNDSLFLATAAMLLKLHSYEFAELALAQDLIHNGYSVPYLHYLSVSHYLEKRYEDAITHITTAVEKYGKDLSLWSLLGHCYYKLNNTERARECYEEAIQRYDETPETRLLQLRLAGYYLQAKEYSTAKTLFSNVCKHSPSPRSWLGLGVACYAMNELQEAQLALTEANFLDNTSPYIWGYLALLNLRLERHPEFEQCYKQTIRHKLQDESLLKQIEELRERLEFPDPLPLRKTHSL